MIVSGKKGSSGGKQYTPKEDKNNLQAKTTARIVDLLCEGEISGPAIDDDWEKSTYFNEIPVKSATGSYNYEGVTIDAKTGTSSQDYLSGFDTIEVENSVNVQVTKTGGAISRTITDSNIDDVKVTMKIPYLMEQTSKGDLKKTTVKFDISITPDNGAGSEQYVVTHSGSGIIRGKCTSEYRRQYLIEDLSQYGNSPWVVKVYRYTDDSSSAKLTNDTYWYSYTTVVNTKLRYMDRAVVGITLDAESFGDSVPKRAWKIKGRKVKYPSNYDPVSRGYTGNWDGTFVTGYTNNPAWVMYDILTDPDIGLGDRIDETQVDKWGLYTIAQYCDGTVNYTERERQSDGTYTTTSGTEPRFTFNGVIQSREHALRVIAHLASVFRGFPIWTTGEISFVQDSPSSVTRVASPSNVVDGIFEYEGSPKRFRNTAVKVSYNDPTNFGRLDVVTVENPDGIKTYGYIPADVTAFGCTSKSEAIRRGKFILDTNINTTESVKFTGGFEWADALPGDLVDVQDPAHAGVIMEGRVVSSTTTSITIDKSFTIESGETYTLMLQQNTTDIVERTLTNSVGSTTTFTWSSALSEAPQAGNVWILSSTSVVPRTFRIINIKEDNNKYTIFATEYDANKYSRIESNVVHELPPTTIFNSDVLTAPTNITCEAYSYVDGDSDNRKYGIQIGWVHSTDPRTDYYELRYRFNDDAWVKLGETFDNSYDWRDVDSGTYDISVRGQGIVGASEWLTYTDFTLNTTVSGLLPPTNLQVFGGGSTWGGPDCHITWSGSGGHYYEDDTVGDSNVKGYKVEVRKSDSTLLRTYFTASKEETEYIYTYDMNNDDNSGSPLRTLQFWVYTIDVYDTLSATYASLSASNPAPDMSSGTPTITSKPAYLKVEWTAVSDNDMDYYKVYCDTSNPPTTHVGTVSHPGTLFEVHGLEYGTTYYVQIEPYDGFGAGTKSSIPSGASPTQIPDVNVDVELANSLTIAQDASAFTGTLTDLYDGVFDSGGISSSNPNGHYIKYTYNIENYFDRIGIWSGNTNPRVYLSYSTDDSTWSYLKAESDHTLDSDDRLLSASSQSDAQTNYWQLDTTGINVALWPDNLSAKYIRIHFVNTNTTTIYEMIPSRIIISELAAIESLSAISVNAGTITAGNLQSDNYGASAGMNIDLDSKRIYLHGSSSPALYYDDATDTLNIDAVVTFRSGTTGIANTDAGDLATQDTVDWSTDVTGTGKPEDDATDNSAWEHPSDTTKIDGGELYVGSSITLNEGGKATFGDQNVIINTEGSKGAIVISEDGGPDSHDYCQLSDGDINFYYWTGSEHLPYKTLKRIERGIADNDTNVNIPGVFKSAPSIMISPNTLQSYNADYSNQSQTLRFDVIELTEYETNKWRFKPKARLELADGSASGGGGNTKTYKKDGKDRYWTNLSTTAVSLPANTRRIVVQCSGSGYSYKAYQTNEGSGKDPVWVWYTSKWVWRFYLRLYYYSAGAWHYIQSGPYKESGNTSLDTDVQSNDITKYYVMAVHHDDSDGGTLTGNLGHYTTETVTDGGYSGDLTAAAVLANGTLNWIAVGE